MFDKELWTEIFYSIKSNKLRTFLTGFSVAWGIFILVMLLASVKGMENGFRKEMMHNASNSIFIYPSKTKKAYKGFEAGRKIKLTNEDVNFIKQSFTDEYEYLTPIYENTCTAKYKKETGSYSLKGVEIDYFKIKQIKLTQGRFLYTADKHKKNVMIGQEVATDLFGKEDSVGKDIIINNALFKVVGVFTHSQDSNVKQAIICPISSLQRMYKGTNSVSTIALTYNSTYNLIEAKAFSKYLKNIFKRRHNIAPDDNGFYFDDSIDGYSEMTSFVRVLQGISVFIGMLILMAGIVGIGNILVVIIKERTKEIGIRKAIGARPLQVLNLVILESIFITTFSGLFGVFFAMMVVGIVGPLIDAPAFSNPSVDVEIILIALVILIVSGILAGLIPAIRASRVKPIVALRED